MNYYAKLWKKIDIPFCFKKKMRTFAALETAIGFNFSNPQQHKFR